MDTIDISKEKSTLNPIKFVDENGLAHFSGKLNLKFEELGTELEILKTTTDDKMTILKSGFNSEINDLRLDIGKRDSESKRNIKALKDGFGYYKDKTNDSLMKLSNANIELTEELNKLQDIFVKMCFILPTISVGITLIAINFIK